MRGADSVSLEGFPEERVALMGVSDFHAVDLDEDEVVEFFGEDARV